MSLGAGQLASVLAVMHPEVDEASLDARMKYMQRRSFPSPRVAVGKGWRADYGPNDLMMLVWAFELLAFSVPPQRTIDLLLEGWADVEATMRGAWLERERREFALPVIVRDLGVAPRAGGAGSLAAATADDLRRWLQGQGDFRAALIVDALRMARAVDDALNRALPEDRAAGIRSSLEIWAARGLQKRS